MKRETDIPKRHPEPAQLEAFAMGRLATHETGSVETHLRDCAACGKIVSAAPVDALVALLRRNPVPSAPAARIR